jgi:hypothetical protein
MRYLPGLIANLAPHVDGIVALDDGSTDGTREYLESRSEVLEVLTNPPGRPAWDEPGNHARLVHAAVRHGAEWMLAIDADERVERLFRQRAERVMLVGETIGARVLGLQLLDLWSSRALYRTDGSWRGRTRGRLFASHPEPELDSRPLHHTKAPLQHRGSRRPPEVGIRIYHLRMVHSNDRAARRRRYEDADPNAQWQAIGYGHMTDERGLELRPVRSRRGFVDGA